MTRGTKRLSVLLSLGIASSIMVTVPKAAMAASAKPRAAKTARSVNPVLALTTLEKEIARSIASGEPIPAIIKQLIASGNDIHAVVEAMIEAGADPSAVVYHAIVDGHSARSVVESALKVGVAPTFVVRAALSAGADERMIYLGATDAGLSPGVIATAVAAAKARGLTAGGGQVLLSDTEDTSGDGIPVSFTGISSLGMIGGGGGATPSTRVASPYKP